MAKKKGANLLPKLTETEQDLLSQIQDGYQLEADSLGGNPVLRRLKDNYRFQRFRLNLMKWQRLADLNLNLH
jgi:hypothetical protein